MAKKRNFRRMGGPVWYRQWNDWDEGDTVTGTIVDTSIDKKYKRTNYHIKVEEKNFDVDNQNGEPLKEGDVLVVNGCGILEKHLAGASRGDAVQLVYAGQAEITGGDWEGEKAHNIEVYLEEGEATSASGADDDGDDLLGGEEDL